MPALAHVKAPALPVSTSAPDLPLDTAAPKAPFHLHGRTGSPFRRRRAMSAPRPPLSARTREERAARLPQKPLPAKPAPTRNVQVNETAIRALRAARAAAAGGTPEAKEAKRVEEVKAEVKQEASARKAAGQEPSLVQREGAKVTRNEKARQSRAVRLLRAVADKAGTKTLSEPEVMSRGEAIQKRIARGEPVSPHDKPVLARYGAIRSRHKKEAWENVAPPQEPPHAPQGGNPA